VVFDGNRSPQFFLNQKTRLPRIVSRETGIAHWTPALKEFMRLLKASKIQDGGRAAAKQAGAQGKRDQSKDCQNSHSPGYGGRP
jgi:hypothetical protein